MYIWVKGYRILHEVSIWQSGGVKGRFMSSSFCFSGEGVGAKNLQQMRGVLQSLLQNDAKCVHPLETKYMLT